MQFVGKEYMNHPYPRMTHIDRGITKKQALAYAYANATYASANPPLNTAPLQPPDKSLI